MSESRISESASEQTPDTVGTESTDQQINNSAKDSQADGKPSLIRSCAHSLIPRFADSVIRSFLLPLLLAAVLLATRAPGGLALNRAALALNSAALALDSAALELDSAQVGKQDATAAYGEAGTAFLRAAEGRGTTAARAYAGLGAIYDDFGDTAAAAQAYGEAVARAPGDRMAQFFYGEALAALGQEAAAREAWAAAQAQDVLVGRAKDLKGSDPEGALLNAERAVAVAPDAPESVGVLGEILSAQGAYTDALAVYQSAALRAPDEAAFHREAGILLRRRFGDAEGARTALEAALALAPDDAATRLELARIFADRGACYEAEAYLDFLLSGPPVGGNEKTAHVLAAQCHLDQGRPRTAIPYLEAVVSDMALAGKDPAISHLLLLAAAYEAAGELATAVATYERILEINPDHAGALAALEHLTSPADE